MTITLQEFTYDFTPPERALLAARTDQLVEEELTFRALRQARLRTRERVAALLHVEQENISWMERRADLLLGALSTSVAAMGGKLRLVAEFPDRNPVAITLADITGVSPLVPRKRIRASAQQ